MNATLTTPPRFLDTAQVAELTGLAEQTLVNWRCTRRAGPPFVRLGARVRYEREALEKWLAEQTVDPKE